MATLANNRRARWRFKILETWEAGIELAGHEVKAVKSGRIDLSRAHITMRTAESRGKSRLRLNAYLINGFIPKYDRAGDIPGYDPRRTRRLLLRRDQIRRIMGQLEQKGLTMVPLSMYTRNHLVKLQVGLAQGKTEYDKRDTIRKRESDRNMRAAARRRVK
jgi:SsrA-binding protein